MERRRCAAAGCARFVRAEAAWCGRHGPVAESGDESGAADAALEDAAPEDGEERRRRAAAAFRRRLERGDYRGLFERHLAAVIAQAAAERTLADEIGALRFVLARLLAEEEDLPRLVAGIAKVTTALAGVARAQRAIGGEMADGLTEALTRILIELDAGTGGR